MEDRAGLSRSALDSQLFSTAGSVDTVFVILFFTTVERASWTALQRKKSASVVDVAAVLLAFAVRERGQSKP